MFYLFVFLISLYLILSMFRVLLSYLEIQRQRNYLSTLSPVPEEEITVLQPILGGDPALQYCLESNLKNAPNSKFIWLLDENDPEGINAAKQAVIKTSHRNVDLKINPAPPSNLNPKMWKLLHGIKHAKKKFIAFLDDDTILPKHSLGKCAAIANNGNLVTALPLYSSYINILSCIITGFVNSNSIITYLPTSYLKISNTINGMFSIMKYQDLNIDQFKSILSEATDDYALAKIFKNNGLGIVQTTIPLRIITTVLSFNHYKNLMKRWMIFAKIYLRENFNWILSLLIIIPSFLPTLLLIIAIILDPVAFVPVLFSIILIKAIILKILRFKIEFKSDKKINIVFEVISEIVSPLYFLLISLRDNKITWRKSNFNLNQSGKIKNENKNNS